MESEPSASFADHLVAPIRDLPADIVFSRTAPELIRSGRTDQSEMGGDEVLGKIFNRMKTKPARTKLERLSQIATVVARALQGVYYALRIWG